MTDEAIKTQLALLAKSVNDIKELTEGNRWQNEKSHGEIRGIIEVYRKEAKASSDALFDQTRKLESKRLPCEAPNDDDKCTSAKEIGAVKAEVGKVKAYALGLSAGVTIIINLITWLFKTKNGG